MGPIMVGVDGSPGAAAAVAWAAGCAKAVGSELILVGVTPVAHDVGDVEVLLEGEWAQPASRIGTPYDAIAVAGDPRLALAEVAAAQAADLVVVGLGRERWFPALHLGSTSHYLAHHLDRPLAVIPVGHTAFNCTDIVVGLDGSVGAAGAAKWSADFAVEAGGKVTAVLAWTPSARRVARLTAINSEADAEEACRGWAGLLDSSGVLLECRVAEGDPVAVIAACAEDVGAGLIALGTRGSGGFHDLRLGSVALRLLQGACRPTVLVPAP